MKVVKEQKWSFQWFFKKNVSIKIVIVYIADRCNKSILALCGNKKQRNCGSMYCNIVFGCKSKLPKWMFVILKLPLQSLLPYHFSLVNINDCKISKKHLFDAQKPFKENRKENYINKSMQCKIKCHLLLTFEICLYKKTKL